MHKHFCCHSSTIESSIPRNSTILTQLFTKLNRHEVEKPLNCVSGSHRPGKILVFHRSCSLRSSPDFLVVHCRWRSPVNLINFNLWLIRRPDVLILYRHLKIVREYFEKANHANPMDQIIHGPSIIPEEQRTELLHRCSSSSENLSVW